MWSVLIVIDPPFFDAGTGVAHGQEPGGVETLLAQSAVERFDVGVVGRLPWPGEVQLNLVEVGPLVEEPPGELGAVMTLMLRGFPRSRARRSSSSMT